MFISLFLPICRAPFVRWR